MANRICLWIALLFALPALATTYNVNPSSNLNSVLTGTVNGDTVNFAAGTYSISSSLPLNCGVTLTGPTIANFVPGSNTQTAILSATSSGFSTFTMNGGCTNQTTVQWFWFQNNLSLYVGGGVSNLTYRYNSATNFPEGYNINLDGGINDTSNNINILYNEFGDNASCAAFMGFQDDDDCDAILNHAGNVTSLNIQNNLFVHIQEPIHIIQICTGCSGSQTVSICNGCTIQYNYLNTFARIGMEIQTSNTGATDLFSDNVVYNPTEGNAFGVSLACCLSGRTFNVAPGTVPADFFDDNVVIFPQSSAGGPFGVEFWGQGAAGRGNLMEGKMSNGFAIGFFGFPSTNYGIVANNYMCEINTSNGGYFTNEESCGGQSCVPTNLTYPGNTNSAYIISGGNNQTSTTCSQQSSAGASISPASGSQSFPLTVNLSTAGRNTSVYYTTDGSTPVPGQGSTQLYSAPFALSSAGTVKAVGMWGVPPQPTSYAAPYGYVPSSVTTATYSGGGGTPTAAAPTFSPVAGSYSSAQSVSLASTTPSATINYCINCTPTTSSSTYTSPISVSSSETINAITSAIGFLQSAVSSATYAITAPGAVATPTFSPNGGPYTGTQSVTASTSTSGATLFCTTNGTTPTTSSPVYSGAFTLTSSPSTTTIQCIGTAPGSTQSAVGSATFTYTLYLGNNQANFNFQTYANGYACTYAVTGTNLGGYTVNSCVINQFGGNVASGANTDCAVITAPTPTTEATSALCHGTWTNPSGTGTTAGSIAMSGCGTLAASSAVWICTNTNDASNPSSYGGWNCGGTCSTTSVPTSNNGTYAGAIQNVSGGVPYGQFTGFPASMTLVPSGQFSQYLTLSAVGTPTASAPSYSPAGGTYTTAQTVTLSSSTSGATIYFTTDGTTPSTGSTRYTAPINVAGTTTVQSIAVAGGFSNSPVSSATYTITSAGPAATPSFTPGPLTFSTAPLSVTAASTTSGASLFCTRDGTTPTTASPAYAPFSLSATTTLQCIATAFGFTTSGIGSATYTFMPAATVTTTPYPITVANGATRATPGAKQLKPRK